jgi:hypothetical protein
LYKRLSYLFTSILFYPRALIKKTICYCELSSLLLLTGLLLSTVAEAQVAAASRQPARHLVAVAHSTNVTVGFAQAIAAAAAPNPKVYRELLGGKRPGRVAGGGTTRALAFTPNLAFAPDKLLSVSEPAFLTSTSGATVARQVYQFTAATSGVGRG